jgi:hypothetical protein
LYYYKSGQVKSGYWYYYIGPLTFYEKFKIPGAHFTK